MAVSDITVTVKVDERTGLLNNEINDTSTSFAKDS